MLLVIFLLGFGLGAFLNGLLWEKTIVRDQEKYIKYWFDTSQKYLIQLINLERRKNDPR